MSVVLAKPTIFLSFAASDSGFAEDVGDVLQRSGAKVWKIEDIAVSGNYTSEVRRTLDRSAGVVVALAHGENVRDIPASVLFEIGAATGARKPVFVVVNSPISRLPFNVPGMQVIPFNRIGEIPRLIELFTNDAERIRPTG